MSTIHKQGRLRGDKILYKDGVGYCVWFPLPGDPDTEDCGICFDIPEGDMEDLVSLLGKLRAAKPDVYEEEKS